MSTYQVRLYRAGVLLHVCQVRARSSAEATALLLRNNPECEAVGEG